MSGGVYGGGERASGFGLLSLARPHLKACVPNRRDPSSGHLGPVTSALERVQPRVWVLRHSYLRSSPTPEHPAQPLHPSTHHRPAPGPFLASKESGPEQGHWARRDSGSLTPPPHCRDPGLHAELPPAPDNVESGETMALP